MKIQMIELQNRILRAVVLSTPLLMGLSSCSNDLLSNSDSSLTDSDSIIVVVTVEDQGTTRAPKLISSNIKEYGVRTIFNNKPYSADIQYTYNPTRNRWQKKGTLTWNNQGDLDLLCISPGFNRNIANVTINGTERSFEYLIPTQVKDQDDLCYSSQYKKNKKNTGGKVGFTLKHALASVGIMVKQSIQLGQVEVNQFTLHNVIDGGKFKFDMNRAQKASWENNTTRTSITQDYSNPIPLDASGYTSLRELNTDFNEYDLFFLMPQQTTDWAVETDPTNSKWTLLEGRDKDITSPALERVDTATANALGQSYVELKCRIFCDEPVAISEQYPTGRYIVGWNREHPELGGDQTGDEFISIFFPFTKVNLKMGSSISYFLSFDGGYDENGFRFKITPMISTHDETQPTTFVIENWTDDDDGNSQEITF